MKVYLIKILSLVLCLAMLFITTGCSGNSNNVGSNLAERVSVGPTATTFISQLEKSGIELNGEDEEIFIGEWNDGLNFRTRFDLSGLDDSTPSIYGEYITTMIEKDGFDGFHETGMSDVDDRFEYLSTPIIVYLKNFAWSIKDYRELSEKFFENGKFLDEENSEFVSEFTENQINYHLEFVENRSMSISIKILDTSVEQSEIKQEEPEIKSISDNLEVKDIVKFGSYEQDDNLENGNEDIEWIVIKVENGKALLLSRYILDSIKYYTYDDIMYSYCSGYDKSDIRQWLKENFYKTAFDDNEKNSIITSKISCKCYSDTKVINNNFVNDEVFILRYEEIPEDPSIMVAFPTKYCLWNQPVENTMIGTSSYWAINEEERGGKCITNLGREAFTIFGSENGVRPAVWVEYGK